MHLNGSDYPSWKRDPQAKRYSRIVTAVCAAGFIAFVAIAAVCAAVNHWPKAAQ